jgi:hypothetical protein
MARMYALDLGASVRYRTDNLRKELGVLPAPVSLPYFGFDFILCALNTPFPPVGIVWRGEWQKLAAPFFV